MVPGLHGTQSSGAFVTGADPDIIAHEIAHGLGLQHTSELRFTQHDAIEDTPECPGLPLPAESAPCFRNLMYSSITLEPEKELTPGQMAVITTSPFAR